MVYDWRSEKEIEVPATALKHWEKEGLIKPSRDPESGYRVYGREDLRRVHYLYKFIELLKQKGNDS